MKNMLLRIFKKNDELIFKVKASPIFWRIKAEELKYASELIWPHAIARLDKISIEPDLSKLEPDTFSIYLSLIGFSTECLFKASAIRDNPEFVSNGTLASKLRGHDLIKLANLAKIGLSQNEQIFCKQAYRAMVVDSRYPIALESEPINGVMMIGGNCKEVFESLYNKLYPNLNQINSNKKK
jgi:hypothetical protein